MKLNVTEIAMKNSSGDNETKRLARYRLASSGRKLTLKPSF